MKNSLSLGEHAVDEIIKDCSNKVYNVCINEESKHFTGHYGLSMINTLVEYNDKNKGKEVPAQIYCNIEAVYYYKKIGSMYKRLCKT